MNKLVVSIHDVSPFTREECTAMLSDLRSIGVEKTSLLVIPDHHHRGHFINNQNYSYWLEQLASQGHELVVHGYYHQRAYKTSESIYNKIVTRVYTSGEGEFFDLSFAESLELLTRALADFVRLDAPAPVGFIAPAWLLGSEAEKAVRESGFRYTTRLREILELFTGIHIPSQSLVYSCRNAWRRTASRVWNPILANRLRSNPLLRVSLHPPDIRHPEIWQQALSLIKEAKREPTTYAGYLS